MFLVPAKMMEGMGVQTNDSISLILQAMCVMLFTIAVITFWQEKMKAQLLFGQYLLEV
ncbi:MAG: hypothetical protein ABI851_14975 [Saprospiraceae bacterium]